MQIQLSVFICVHPWFKERKSKAPSKRQPDSIIIGVPLNPYNFLEKKEPRMNSDGHGLKPIAGIHSSPLAFIRGSTVRSKGPNSGELVALLSLNLGCASCLKALAFAY